MSAPLPTAQQLRIELQKELIASNQLLKLIHIELQKLKNATIPGGELDENVKQSVQKLADLAKLKHVNITNLPAFTREPSAFTDIN